jgi:hypothetical protein
MRWAKAATALGSVFLLSGCGALYNPLFVGGDAAHPVIGWRDCPGAKHSGIEELGLYRSNASSTEDDPGKLLWHITAGTGTVVEKITLGEAPPGFTTELPLTTTLTRESTYALRANMDSDDEVTGFLTFRPEQLVAGQVVFSSDSGIAESLKKYKSRNDEDFGCFAD